MVTAPGRSTIYFEAYNRSLDAMVERCETTRWGCRGLRRSVTANWCLYSSYLPRYPLQQLRVVALEAQLAWFKKQMFGGGKSEKLDVTQRQLALEGVDQARAAVANKTEEIEYERRERSRDRRRPRSSPMSP